MTRAAKSQTKVVAQPSSEVSPVKSLETQPVSLLSSSSPVVEQQPQKQRKSTKKAPKESADFVPPPSTPVPSSSLEVVPTLSKSESSSSSETPVISVETLDGELLNVDEFDTKCSEFYTKLQELTGSISTIRSEFKAIEKVWAKRLKTATKTNIKKKKKSGNRAPSGFVKPTKISDELALFLSKPVGTEMARTEVTREINLYIRANKLQDTTNGRKINADKKLADLLHLPSEDELTYFNLQKYMSVHFPKTPVVV